MLNNNFQFAGRSMAELASLSQSAPLFVYSRAAISARIKLVKASLPSAVKLHYSIKANPHPLTIAHIAGRVNGMDVASHAEMLLALGAGVAPENISFSGPGKTDLELHAAVTAGIVIHAESVSEVERVLQISNLLNQRPLIALRINPEFSVKQSGMVMGGGSQPFGIDLDQLGNAMSALKSSGIACTGLHCYAGSQMLNASHVCKLQEQTFAMMMELVHTHDLVDVSLNLGGGFGVPYYSHEQALDIAQVGENLGSLMEHPSLEKRVGSVIIELGRYLVAEAGIYIARVTEKKQSRGKQFLIVQGGMNHHLAASGNLGQTIRRNFPVVGSSTRHDETLAVDTETVSVVGPLCTPLDILASDIELPRLERGDHIAVLNSGAYGYSASPHGFLSHPLPVEILL